MADFFPTAQAYGFDFSEEGIKVAQNIYSDSNIIFQVADITKEYIEKFDLISMFEVLEHIEDWQGMLSSIAQKVNKYLLLSFPTGRMRKYETYGGHLRNFKKNEVETFLYQLGFKPITVYYAGFPFFSPIYRDGCSFFPNSVLVNNMNNIMSKKLEWLHHVVLFLSCYCSTRKHLGEQFIGLFEK